MSLRKKIVLCLLAVVAMSVLLTSGVLWKFVYPTFDALQKNAADSDLSRVELALEGVATTIDTTVLDTAEWDESYAFVQGQNTEHFIESNLQFDWYLEMNIHLVAFFNAEGKLIFGKYIEPDTGLPAPIDEILLAPLGPNDPVVQHTDIMDGVEGLLHTKQGPILIASRPVLTSMGMGPIAGTIIMGRLLDADGLLSIQEQTDAVFSLIFVSEGEGSPEDRAIAELALAEGVAHSENPETHFTHKIIRDIYGNPSYMLRVETPREIAAVGLNALQLALVLFMLTALFPVASIWVLIQRLVIVPVTGLGGHILRLRATGDLSQRIETQRVDEFGTLADEFDALTGDLEAARQEMQKSRDSALELARLKSEFLATMSHEIRTPMNGVIGMTEMLLAGDLPGKQRRYAETIQSSADGLLAIVNDILDFSKLESGSATVDRREFGMVALVDETIRTFAGAALASNVALTHDVAPDLDASFEGDSNRLRQLLINLIGNAIKFTIRGQISVRVSVKSAVEDEYRVRFEVRDTGVGIAAENLEHIFGSFAQADSSTTRNFGGTGLGLAICKTTVELLGGEIGVESEFGVGSTFWFVVPLKRTGAAPAAIDQISEASDTRVKRFEADILLVEDNAVNELVALAMLEHLGCHADTASDGQEALAVLAERSYDLILMDCQMPVMDGFAATAEIRRRERESRAKARVPIIALTANAVEGDRERCLASEMDDYLSKPFREQQLIDVLMRWLPEDRMTIVTNTPDKKSDLGSATRLDATVLDQLRALQSPSNPHLLSNLIEAYRDTSTGLMEDLRDAVEKGIADAIGQAAHALKSSSRNLGAKTLAFECEALEKSARAGEIDGAKALCDRISKEHPRVLEALAEIGNSGESEPTG